jgi:hypothetical protein
MASFREKFSMGHVRRADEHECPMLHCHRAMARNTGSGFDSCSSAFSRAINARRRSPMICRNLARNRPECLLF